MLGSESEKTELPIERHLGPLSLADSLAGISESGFQR